MLVSYKWLQRYFDELLPAPEALAEKLTFGAFEIEGIEKKGNDVVLDVKVLPDRACYALSHRGIAKEISTLTGIPMKSDPLCEPYPTLEPQTDEVHIAMEDEKRAPYYAVALIRGVKVGPSPLWLKEYLEAVGQKSINNIVDATNFVMLDLGTPLHAFDSDRLGGAIGVRPARDGESITILGGQKKTLTEEMTVITDAKTDAPIALAGVKGGAVAELTSGTTNIILEAAKFDPTRTRKTATALGLKTDASKRFENNIAIELSAYGMRAVVALILDIAGGELVGYTATAVPYKFPFVSGISSVEANRLLGTQLTDDDVSDIFDTFGFSYERISDPVAKAIEIARAQEGKPYQAKPSFRDTVPNAYDCSSFVSYAYVEAGVPFPRTSVDQYVWGDPVDRADLKPGDLIFANSGEGHIWQTTDKFIRGRKVPEGVDHVGMYLGDDEVIHATRAVGKVVIEKLAGSKGFANIVGCCRMASSAPRFKVNVPFERLDLRIPQDLIEEIGRVYGYSNIAAKELTQTTTPQSNPRWCAAEAVRKALGELGFAEVYTYTLRSDGEVKLANSLAADKSTLRSSLAPGIHEALEKNAYNAPLLGLDTVKIFEIGNVFTKAAEELHVCVGVRPLAPKKRSEKTNAALLGAKDAIEKELGVKVDHRIAEETLEFNLGAVLAKIHARHVFLPLAAEEIEYKPLSPYPFVLRDIALWLSEGTAVVDVLDVIRAAAGPMLVRLEKFDEFTKEGRTSYAFHLVFQSAERTLTDAEVSTAMESVNAAVKASEWEVR